MSRTQRFHALLASVCVTASLLAVVPAQAATIGNVTSFSTAGQDVTFNISDGSKVRISILTADMARVRVAPSGAFGSNISRAVVMTSWPAASFSAVDGGSAVTITTGAMKLVVLKTPFVLECRDLSNNLIVTDDPSRRIQWDSGRTEVYKTTQANEKYVGLGWRTHGLVRNGTRFTMRNEPTYTNPDTFNAGVPLWYGLRNGSAYGIFFDDTSWGTIDLTTTTSGYLSFKNLGGMVDYYYFAGPSMATILDRYTELTGRPFMPPRWSVGYHQCRWSYMPRSQVLSIASEFRTRNIPCDVIYLDIDYMDAGKQLTFKPSTFPNPDTMCGTLHGQGFQVIANIGPWLLKDSAKYNVAKANGYLLTYNGQPQLGWHDYVYYIMGAPTGWLGWVDFSHTGAKTWYQGEHTPFLNNGIDGIWNDLNEPQELGGAWPTTVKYRFGDSASGLNVDHNKTANQYCLLQSEFSYGTLQNHYPARRPFVLSRGGYAGIQRYAALWSADNRGDWVTDYKLNIPMGLSMSISGNPNNGHDIGGFLGYPGANDAPSPELYARWMQSGVFNPFCRQHHDGWGEDPNRPFVEPWRFGTTVENICRNFIGLRYRLMPYLYTLFHNAHTTGEPVQRPTLFDFPADPATLTQDYDFMFGPNLLVSPVTTAGATTWNTYLPAGADWINWWNDTLYAGGQTVNTAAPLERLPIFVRGGAILPMAPVSQYEGQAALSELTLELYPVDTTTSFTLYEDDGISWNYLGGGSAETVYTMSGVGDSFTLDIAARQGGYVPASRSYLLKVHRWPGHTLAAMLNGTPMTEHATWAQFEAAGEGYYLDAGTGVLYAKFADTGAGLTFAFGGVSSPYIACAPGSFTRTVTQGSDLSNDAFTVWNAGADTLEYDITDDAPWLDVVPADGTSTGSPNSHQVAYAVAALAPGTYQAAIAITDPDAGNSPQGITVSVTVDPLIVPGDIDGDADVDQEDFGRLQFCLTAAGEIQSDPACEGTDLDGDGDVDADDVAKFLGCMSGPKVYGNPDCLN